MRCCEYTPPDTFCCTVCLSAWGHLRAVPRSALANLLTDHNWNSILRFPQRVKQLCFPSVNCDEWDNAPTTRPLCDARTAGLSTEPPALSFFGFPWVPICPSGLLVFAAACIDLLKPRTADSGAKKTCGQRFLFSFFK